MNKTFNYFILDFREPADKLTEEMSLSIGSFSNTLFLE